VSSAYERIGRLLHRHHLEALPRDVSWNRSTLAINTSVSALADYQAGAFAILCDYQLPLDRVTSELVTASTGLLTAPALQGVGRNRGRAPAS
jgi:hypothetical protein